MDSDKMQPNSGGAPSNRWDRIERLKRGLYSRKTPDIIDAGRSDLERGEFNPPVEWQHTESNSFDALAARIAHSSGNRHSLAKKVFSISLGIFVLSIIVAGFVFFGGMNLISSKNVEIEVVGPVSVAGGEETSFDIIVDNKNNADLDVAKLTVTYPEGVRKEGNLSEDVDDEVFDLGKIKSGDRATQNLKIYLFGKKDEVKQFRLTLDYKVKNSNGNFFKEKLYDVSISSAPIIVTSTYPKEVNSNQEVNFSIEAFSNSPDSPDSFLVNVEYPFGFTFKGANPAPIFGNNTWKFSGLKTGDKRTINISGNIAGQDNEERVFRVNAGTEKEDDPRKIGVLLVSTNESMFIKKPFLGLDLRVSGASSDYVAQSTNNINVNLKLQNNVLEKIFNAEAAVSLSGSAFSGSSVRVDQNGFFRSVDNTIVWDKRSVSKLSELGPGDYTDLSFSLSPLQYEQFAKGSKPEITMKVRVEGDRILESGESEHISSTEEKTIKLSTDLQVSQNVTRVDGGITNSGPMPPKANNKTTYTVVWNIKNTFNNTTNVIARATLPQYVEWTGVVSPNGANITFDPNTHQVIWNAGQVSSGTGFTSSPKTVMFQVSLLPSTSQIGSAPDLVNNVSVSGIDKEVNKTIEASYNPVTTKFNDSSYRINDEKVVP